MGRLGLAFRILFNGKLAQQVQRAISDTPAVTHVEAKPAAPVITKPTRSEALTLLAAFQREARFVDFLQEPIDGYSDAQVGAAVREIHRGCRTVVDRMFAPGPIVDQAEGSSVQISNAASELYRLTGNVSQKTTGSITGQLMHHGWKATRIDVPQWSGDPEAASVIGPAEVQIS